MKKHQFALILFAFNMLIISCGRQENNNIENKKIIKPKIKSNQIIKGKKNENKNTIDIENKKQLITNVANLSKVSILTKGQNQTMELAEMDSDGIKEFIKPFVLDKDYNKLSGINNELQQMRRYDDALIIISNFYKMATNEKEEQFAKAIHANLLCHEFIRKNMYYNYNKKEQKKRKTFMLEQLENTPKNIANNVLEDDIDNLYLGQFKNLIENTISIISYEKNVDSMYKIYDLYAKPFDDNYKDMIEERMFSGVNQKLLFTKNFDKIKDVSDKSLERAIKYSNKMIKNKMKENIFPAEEVKRFQELAYKYKEYKINK